MGKLKTDLEKLAVGLASISGKLSAVQARQKNIPKESHQEHSKLNRQKKRLTTQKNRFEDAIQAHTLQARRDKVLAMKPETVPSYQRKMGAVKTGLAMGRNEKLKEIQAILKGEK